MNSTNIHLCIDCRMIQHSGIGKYLQNIVNGFLSSNDYKVTLLGNNTVLRVFFSNLTYEVIEFNAPIYSIKEQLFYTFIIPRCDFFWSPHYNVPILPIKASKRLVSIHDVYHLAFKKDISLLQIIYSRVLLQISAFYAWKIVTVSEFSKSEIIRFLGNNFESKIIVIHNGVDLMDKSRLSQRGDSKRQYFLYVGNIKPHKNLKNLILAFETISLDFPEIDLYLVGKKEGFINGSEEIIKLALERLSERVIFTGWVSEGVLEEYYKNALALVFPSIYEGFGLPPLEAMAHGCPTIVSNIPPLREVCGDAALFFNPFDHNSIAKSMKYIIESEPERLNLIKKGFERSKVFSWDKSVESHKKIFSENK